MITIIKKINTLEIISSYMKIEKGIQWTEYGHKGKQAGLQYKDGDDVWSSAVGKSKGNEFGINLLNPFFKDSIFESIIAEYNLKRTRLMWSGPFSCYSMHKDTSPRVHIPLFTNKDCYFLFNDRPPSHMPEGFVYWVDTRKFHTFVNCSEKSRLHLVGIVED
jgi:hypothetical protein